MAKREKDLLYYEITKEKPIGSFQILLVGGSAGSVMGFLIASLVGACAGIEMDTLVLVFLVSGFFGFFLGMVIMWFGLRYFGKLIPGTTEIGGKPDNSMTEETSSLTEPMDSAEAPIAVENDEAKGKSVDFVFPELSPDKQ